MNDGPVPRTCHFSADDQSLVVQYGTDAEVWALSGPIRGGFSSHPPVAPRAVAPHTSMQSSGRWCRSAPMVGPMAGCSTQKTFKGCCGATPTGLAEGEPSDLKRWCACESCFGRMPEVCAELSEDPLTADLDRLASWCPAVPDERG